MLVQPKHIENQIHCRNIPPSLYGSSFAFKRYKQFHFNTLIYVFVRKRQFAFQTYILAIASFLKYFLMSSFYSHKLDEQCQYQCAQYDRHITHLHQMQNIEIVCHLFSGGTELFVCRTTLSIPVRWFGPFQAHLYVPHCICVECEVIFKGFQWLPVFQREMDLRYTTWTSEQNRTYKNISDSRRLQCVC